MRGPLLIFVAVALAACAQTSEIVRLRNAAGQTVQCGPYMRGPSITTGIELQTQVRDCVADFQRQGFERVP